MNRIIFGFLVIILLCPIASLHALTNKVNTNINGISMSPFLENVSLNQNQTSTSFPILYTNHTSLIQELDFTVQDYGSLNNTGGVLLEGSNSYTQKYGLTSWMSLSTNVLTLNPNTSGQIMVSLTNTQSLTPGGHYGAVVAKVNNFNSTFSSNIVSVNQQLVNLILLNKLGGDHFDLKLQNISTNGNLIDLPSVVNLSFQNPGNVQVVPRGVVRLLSPTNQILSQGIINQQSSFILPESFQNMIVSLKPISRSFGLPGLYHIVVNFRYDGLNKYYTKEYTIKYFNLLGYFGLLIIIFVMVYLIKKYRKRK